MILGLIVPVNLLFLCIKREHTTPFMLRYSVIGIEVECKPLHIRLVYRVPYFDLQVNTFANALLSRNWLDGVRGASLDSEQNSKF